MLWLVGANINLKLNKYARSQKTRAKFNTGIKAHVHNKEADE